MAAAVLACASAAEHQTACWHFEAQVGRAHACMSCVFNQGKTFSTHPKSGSLESNAYLASASSAGASSAAPSFAGAAAAGGENARSASHSASAMLSSSITLATFARSCSAA